MHDDLLRIGALARAGGPPKSALRFYDVAGVLRPACVDPVTGYRWQHEAHAILDQPGRCSVTADDLRAAIPAVRHAVGLMMPIRLNYC